MSALTSFLSTNRRDSFSALHFSSTPMSLPQLAIAQRTTSTGKESYSFSTTHCRETARHVRHLGTTRSFAGRRFWDGSRLRSARIGRSFDLIVLSLDACRFHYDPPGMFPTTSRFISSDTHPDFR